MSLPRLLTLAGKDDLRIEPTGDIESLRTSHKRVGTTQLPANQEFVLENVLGNAMEIVAQIDAKKAQMFEMNVLRSPNKEEYTRVAFFRGRGYRGKSLVTIDSSYASLLPDVASRAPETAPLLLKKNENLQLRVFIDRSVVEVFVNGKQCVAMRVYPSRPDSVGVSMRSQGKGAVLKSLDAWKMKNIYE
jgi:beta-fructofuranosidase